MRAPELVEAKLREAEYFLTRMQRAGFNQWAFSCDLSAFLSSSRSVTFVLQAVMRHVEGFDEWYAATRGKYLAGPRSALLVELRNVTQKTGEGPIDAGAWSQGGASYYFSWSLRVRLTEAERHEDIWTLCGRHLGALVALVDDWGQHFEALWGLKLADGWEGDPSVLALPGVLGAWEESDAEWLTGTPGSKLLSSPSAEDRPDLEDLRLTYPHVPEM